MGAKNWAPEMNAALIELVDKGLSASSIAKELSTDFGQAFTRNGVIGRCTRLGVQLAGAPCGGRKKHHALPRQPFTPVVVRAPRVIPPSDDPAKPLHLVLGELNENSCRWPYGDGPFTFCGCPKENGWSPYCEHHLRKAFRCTAEASVADGRQAG